MCAQHAEHGYDSRPIHEDDESYSIKRTNRKRKVLSCFPCRDRKMKCDRVYPTCGRCQKTGRSEQCTYDPRLLHAPRSNGAANVSGADASLALSEHSAPESHHSDVSADTLRWKVRVQNKKVEMLGRNVEAKESSQSQPQYQDPLPRGEPEIEEEIMLRRKGCVTQFCGSTSVRSMITHDRVLESIMKEVRAMDQSLLHIKRHFKAVRNRRKSLFKEDEAKVLGIDAEVFAVLPEKVVVDAHVSAFFQTWGTTYRIFHEPSFLEDYYKFWRRPPGDYSQATFAAMLVLIIANTKCLAPKDDVFVDDTSADRDSAASLIQLYDTWFSRQPQKRHGVLFFQLQCVALLTKRVNCIHLKQDWIASGGLIRLAMAAGMHRDLSISHGGKTSDFEKEMRKRLWATIMELELQSSLESGLQSSLGGLYFDTPAPANLPDDAIAPDSQQIPASFPVETFTPMSFLAAASKSLPLRVRLTQLLNNPGHKLQYQDVLHYDTQLRDLLSSLPSWTGDSRATMPSALLKLQLHQYLLILHRPYAKLSLHNQQFMYSFSVCVEVADSMVSIHDDLISKGILALNNLHNDMFRVGIALSQIVYRNCISYDSFSPFSPLAVPTTQSGSDIANQPTLHTELPTGRDSVPSGSPPLAVLPQKSFLARTLCVSSIELLHRTHHLFEQKLMRLGTGYVEYWLLTVSVNILPPPSTSPSQPTFIADPVAENSERHSRYRRAITSLLTLVSNITSKQKNPENEFALNLRDTIENTLATDSRIGKDFEAAIATAGDASYSAISDVGVGINTSAILPGTLDMLEDTQFNLQDWESLDFWDFDLAGHL